MLQEPRVHVTTLAAVVHALVTGGVSRLRDGRWLHDHKEYLPALRSGYTLRQP